jgi:L-ascorbate 6-phosphate lactonase
MAELMQQIMNIPVMPNSLAIWGFGQMGLGIKTPQSMLYVDLCLSDVVLKEESSLWRRAYAPPISPEDIKSVDYYLVTHEHLDHLDPLTIAPIFKNCPSARFVCSGWCKKKLLDLGIPERNIIIPPVFQSIELGDSGIHITAIPTAHYNLDFDSEKGYRWLSYLIEANGVRFYHSGDTIIYPDYIAKLKELPQIDIGILPMNGRDYYRELDGGAIGNLYPAEAVRIAKDLTWDMLIVGHNDMYPFNCIPYSDIASALEKLAPRQKYKVLQPGELYYYVK